MLLLPWFIAEYLAQLLNVLPLRGDNGTRFRILCFQQFLSRCPQLIVARAEAVCHQGWEVFGSDAKSRCESGLFH